MNIMIRWCSEYLVRRGYFVLHPATPSLIVSNGTGTFKETPDGGKEYKIYMKPGHKLYAISHTTLVKEKE